MHNGYATSAEKYVVAAADNEQQRLHRQWSDYQVTFDQKRLYKMLVSNT